MGSTQKSEVAGCCAAIIDSSRRAERIQPTRVNLATKHHGPRFLHHPKQPSTASTTCSQSSHFPAYLAEVLKFSYSATGHGFPAPRPCQQRDFSLPIRH